MTDYRSLRFEDVRSVFRLIGEVRELGRDPKLWREHAISGLILLTGAGVGVSAVEMSPLGGCKSDLRHPVDIGWESNHHRQAFLQFLCSGQILSDPVFPFLQNHITDSFTLSRREIVDDVTWYHANTVQNFHRQGGCDDVIYSRRVLPHLNCADMITIHGRWGDQPLSERAKLIVSLFHDELARLWGPTENNKLFVKMPRHLRTIVEQLAAGHNEKEVADILALSRHTVHAYVKELYLRLKVNSRSEALSKLNFNNDFVPLLFAPTPKKVDAENMSREGSHQPSQSNCGLSQF